MTARESAPPVPQPGVQRGSARLTLQTRQAQRLVRGRAAVAGKAAIVGLLGFANQMRATWQGAQLDDPYADWWLVKVDQALHQAGEQLQVLQAEVEQRVAAVPAIEIDPSHSIQPIQVPLRFGNPFAFRGAQLLARYDDQVRAVLSAGHVGLLTANEAHSLLHRGGRAVRQAFVSPQGYRFLAVTRQDVRQGTAKAKQAIESMGEVPREVVEGTQRAPYAPTRTNPSPVPGKAPNPDRSELEDQEPNPDST